MSITCRLYPAAPSVYRRVVEEDVLQGYRLPKGTVVAYHVGALMRCVCRCKCARVTCALTTIDGALMRCKETWLIKILILQEPKSVAGSGAVRSGTLPGRARRRRRDVHAPAVHYGTSQVPGPPVRQDADESGGCQSAAAVPIHQTERCRIQEVYTHHAAAETASYAHCDERLSNHAGACPLLLLISDRC